MRIPSKGQVCCKQFKQYTVLWQVNMQQLKYLQIKTTSDFQRLYLKPSSFWLPIK